MATIQVGDYAVTKIHAAGVDNLTFKVALCGSAFAWNAATQEHMDDISVLDELLGTGSYARQTQAMTVSLQADHRTEIRPSSDTSFGNITASKTIYYALVFIFITNDAASIPFSAYQLVTPRAPSADLFVAHWPDRLYALQNTDT